MAVCDSADGNDNNAETATAGNHHKIETNKKLSSLLTEYFCDLRRHILLHSFMSIYTYNITHILFPGVSL